MYVALTYESTQESDGIPRLSQATVTNYGYLHDYHDYGQTLLKQNLVKLITNFAVANKTSCF